MARLSYLSRRSPAYTQCIKSRLSQRRIGSTGEVRSVTAEDPRTFTVSLLYYYGGKPWIDQSFASI